MIYLLLACQSPEEPVLIEPSMETLPGVEETELGDGVIEQNQSTPTRQLKRMTIAQIRDSMEQISDGERWGTATRSDWDKFSETLGVADYQLRVESDLSPSPMFQKFLDDAATYTCMEWLRQETTTFFSIDASSVERSDIRSNIVELRWKIQGKFKDDTAPIIDDYEALFNKVYQRTSSIDGSWQSVCVAMFTHPDFFMY